MVGKYAARDKGKVGVSVPPQPRWLKTGKVQRKNFPVSHALGVEAPFYKYSYCRPRCRRIDKIEMRGRVPRDFCSLTMVERLIKEARDLVRCMFPPQQAGCRVLFDRVQVHIQHVRGHRIGQWLLHILLSRLGQ
jgi:hypothetical protein